MERVHASTVAMDGLAVLIRGPSGAGKSDLALRLLDAGAELIADDYTDIRREGARLIASVPASIAGRMEMRGLGIMPVAYRAEAPLGLCLDLVGRDAVDRMPDPDHVSFQDVKLPRLKLDAFAASTPAKVKYALRLLARGEGLWPEQMEARS